MLKTIKVKKKMRLDELIKYVWDNRLSNVFYDSTSRDLTVFFDTFGRIYGANGSLSHIEMHHEFTVEVEKEITEDTEFEAFVVITDKGILKSINNYHNIRAVRGLLENYEVEQKIYALIENKLELIWEAE